MPHLNAKKVRGPLNGYPNKNALLTNEQKVTVIHLAKEG